MDNNTKDKLLFEMSKIDKLLEKTLPLFNTPTNDVEEYSRIIIASSLLHSFYNGVESFAVILFKSIGEMSHNDTQWHKKLLEKIFGDNQKGIILIRKELKDTMVNHMKFRHFYRHTYDQDLEWYEIEPLLENLQDIWSKIKEDFTSFINKHYE